MNKTELVAAMAEQTNLSKIKASKTPKFKAGKALKDMMN